MAYLKFRADQLFTGNEMLGSDQVLLCQPDGTIEGILPIAEAGEGVRSLLGILSPGFINCHCHLELSHLKGMIPEETGMIQFLLDVTGQRNVDRDRIMEAIEEAEKAMLMNGIVAAGDICNTTDTLFQKNKRKLAYHNFIEVIGFIEQTAGKRFALALEVYEQFLLAHQNQGQRSDDFPNRTSLAPHAPYSVSKALMEMIASFPGKGLISIHNQESPDENEFFMNKRGGFLKLYEALGIDIGFFHATGKTSLQNFLPILDKSPALMLVHNVFSSEEDISFAIESRNRQGSELYWCLCPNANLYINRQLPDIPLLEKNQCRIVIGTDSLASNHQLDILSELRTIHLHFPKIKIGSLLEWATISGARALHMDQWLGSFEKGKKPGLVLIDQELQKAERLL
jgi:cytosine/adenosine deaminase-related metal-dependent hydrolase